MSTSASLLIALAAALAAGLLLNRISKKIGLPNVTGYLVAGLLIGPSLWGLIPGDFSGLIGQESLSSLGLVSTVALGFIAFSIGGEFRWKHIKELGRSAISVTLFESLGAVVVVDAVLIGAALLGVPGCSVPTAITLGAISAATAPAATLMVVRQYHAEGPVTRMLLPVVALDDAVTLIVFAVSFAIAKSLAAGEAMTVKAMLFEPLLEIFLSLLIGAALGFLLSFCLRFFHSRQNKTMLGIAAVLAGVAIAEWLGLSSLLLCMASGAFLANFSNESERVFSLIDDWTPVLYLLFFVVSGAQLRLDVLPTVGILGVLYIVFRSLGKIFGTSLGCTLEKTEPAVRKYLGITLLPQAGVAIGLSTVVAATPGFEDARSIQAVILCATLIYELIGPLLTKMALRRAGEIKQK